MGVLKRERRVALFSNLTAMRPMGIVVNVVGMIALICAFGCDKRAGLRPSSGEPPLKQKPWRRLPQSPQL